MSGEILGNAALARFDVLIIGSGTGGAAAAATLTRLGQKVLVLEAGANWFSGLDDPQAAPVPRFSNDELKLGRRGFITPDPLVEPRTFRHRAADGARSFVGDVNSLPKTVGGAAVHADVKTPRFMPMDFQLGTRMRPVPGATFADWPVGYDALTPFYEHMERALGVQGLAGANPFEGPRRGPFPMAPGVPMYAALKLAESARKLGLSPFPYPTAVTSRPYDGRPACVDCGFCGGFGCPINAKGSPAVALLRPALLSGQCQLRSQTRAARLLLSADRRSISGVEVIDPQGQRQTLRADRYLLAASPIEDARLLLLSDPGGAGVGNGSGLVGRNLMFHYQTFAVGVCDERVHGYRGRTVTHGIADFRGVPDDDKRPLGGIIEFGAGVGLIDEALNYAKNFAIGAPLKALLRQSPLRDRLLVLTMQGEDAPQLDNRVDLDPDVKDLDGLPVARVTYQAHAFERAARSAYGSRMLDILEGAGARTCFVAPEDDIPASRHVMGTLRSGADPATSVCDPSGKLHELDNLYAADGALFPTSSGFNPILTIAALATRVAAGLVFPGAPERGLPTA